MSQPIGVIVTGANRGIGKAICEAILKSTSLPAVKLYACSRSGDDLGLKASNTRSSIIYRKLDIADRKSVEDLSVNVDESQQEINVLINNAGINLDREASVDIAKKTLEVNYYGTLNMCQSVIPYMGKGARIVNVSSIASLLKVYDEPIRQRFRTAKSLIELESIANDYVSAVSKGEEEASGFGVPCRSYNVSKALLNGATRILAEEHADVQINSCCPGWVASGMGALIGKPPKTLEEGAVIPMRLAFGDIGDISGQFWCNSSVRSREAGEVRQP
ncbi:hypothetical protein AMS68_006816 [Peltaster fructicola]|uniref:NAD(P)-binding protein n=1 Tax=Peltaster fructicola TaxID=286661 RepID=A0A6H0Y363_9PEZI|nr:hypothetical protein AMS68_006816 [Peltaster fructicola]